MNTSEKINYDLLTVDFVDTMNKLHKIALSNINNHNIELFNTMFDQKMQGVVQGGQFGIFIRSVRNQEGFILDRKTALKAFQRYFQFFLGGDIPKLIKSENVFLLVDIIHKPSTTKTDDSQPTNESLFFNRNYRIITESVNYIFEDTQTQTIERKEIGYWIPYSFIISEKDSLTFSQSFQNNLNDMFDGLMASDDNLRLVTGANESLSVGQVIKSFNQASIFVTSKALLMTNLHNSAVEHAAKILGIEGNQENINQFIINSGMTDDNRTISNKTDKMNVDIRFANENNEIGIVVEISDENNQVGLTAPKEDIQKNKQEATKQEDEIRNKVVAALKEYIKWFAGIDKTNIAIEQNAIRFIPDYNAGKVQINNGEILSISENNSNREKETDKNKFERIGYKIGYNIIIRK